VPQPYEIRANYDRDTIVIYQAYSPAIAEAALKAQKFVAPFSLQRMTWIKPSFLWLMHRSNWGRKSGQQRTLAVRISRAGWEQALSQAVLTSFEPQIHTSPDDWAAEFAAAPVHVQWDTERSLRGAPLQCFSIQVGIGRQVISTYVNEWVVEIEDMTPRVEKMSRALVAGAIDQAKRLLPPERIYPVERRLGRRLLMAA
jgi:hypothetical protein